jgi:erythromycin esterase-like protein
MAIATHLSDLRATAVPIRGAPTDYDALLERIGEKRFVLLGEATHGTHEFYRTRAAITKRLIAEKGFHAVAIEGDWPDSYRVHRFVRGSSDALRTGLLEASCEREVISQLVESRSERSAPTVCIAAAARTRSPSNRTHAS